MCRFAWRKICFGIFQRISLLYVLEYLVLFVRLRYQYSRRSIVFFFHIFHILRYSIKIFEIFCRLCVFKIPNKLHIHGKNT